MIARYSRPEMTKVFSDETKLRRWLEIEIAASQYFFEKGFQKKEISAMLKSLRKLLKSGGVASKEVQKVEKVTRHDVIAFTTVVSQKIGTVKSRFLHFGLTSSDVLDTALCLSIQEGGRLILNDLDRLMISLKRRALQFKKVSCMGRTHGVFAEPMSFGMKFLGFWSEFGRNRARVERSLLQLRVGKLSGAVGTNTHISPRAEILILKKLGLGREPIATQVVPRDRIAELMTSFAILAGSIERVCLEIRLLQRTEVGEVREGFKKKQKGSSAMPHKRNPIASENLTGCARMLRSYSIAALENIALWHERDISHSSVERVFLPDSFILLDYSLDRLTEVIDDLEVLNDGMAKNLTMAGGRVFSGHLLLELVAAGAPREQAYYWVQECALQSQDQELGFEDLAISHPSIMKFLTGSQVKKSLSLKFQLANLDEVYRQVLGEKSR